MSLIRRSFHMPALQLALQFIMANCCSNFALQSISQFPGDGCFFLQFPGEAEERVAIFSLRTSCSAEGIIVFPSSSLHNSHLLPLNRGTFFHFHRFSHSQWMTEIGTGGQGFPTSAGGTTRKLCTCPLSGKALAHIDSLTPRRHVRSHRCTLIA